MNTLSFTFLILSFFLGAKTLAASEIPARDVSLEWDPIEGAVSYDVEVTEKSQTQAKPQVFNAREAIWKGRLTPGYYVMRVRSKDHRKVPGDWSELIDLTVLLSPPFSSELKSQARVDSQEPEMYSYTFQWQTIPGADSYSLRIESTDGKVLFEHETASTAHSIELPVGQTVKWTLIGKNSKGLVSESPLQGSVDVWGPPLEKPSIAEPTSPFVRELTWQASKYSQDTHYSLQVQDPQTKKWRTIDTQKDFKGDTLKFASSWPGGRYRLSLKSQAPLRQASKITGLQFMVQDGDRSEEAEYHALIRQSIARTTGWFVTASYLVTAMQYTGINADNGGAAPLKVDLPNNFGGTGRLGAGWMSDRSPWGFLGVMDMSGFIVASKNPRFVTLEANAIYRKVIGKNGEFRQQLGMFYKEVPEIIAQDLSSIDRIEKIVASGPHYGFEYWWALTPKLGFQVNGHAYGSLLSVKTPTGNPISPSFSYQAGLMGSYRLGERATGLMGYAYRQDSQAYQSAAGRTNSVNITGHYLNLFLEWAL